MVNIFSGVFVCRAGNALIDYRAYFRSSINGHKPVALFFQAKHSGVQVAGNSVTLDWLMAWYNKCSDAFAKVALEYRVGFVLVTNRVVTLPSVKNWPDNLLVISRTELSTYLGPLAHRGLLAKAE